jgi:hypothetical protein
MPDSLIKLVEDLIDFGYGDVLRLDAILNALKQGRKMYTSDQRYVDMLVSKHLFPRGSDVVVKLRDEIKDLNERLDKAEPQGSKFRGSTRYKSEGTALVLSMFFGLLGFMGFGHRYVGDIVKSLTILFFGWVLLVLNILNFIPLIASSIFHQETNYRFPFLLQQISQSNLHLDPFIMIVITALVLIGPTAAYFVLYIWQIFHARNLIREFNETMDRTGNQLYEVTVEKKIIFVLIAIAPIIGSTIFYFTVHTTSLQQMIGIN